MRRTIADPRPTEGRVAEDGASASWIYEGGVAFLYDVVVERAGALAAVVSAIDVAARECGAAVLTTTLWEGAPETPEFLACGFVRDWAELSVRDGAVAREIGYVRVVGGSV